MMKTTTKNLMAVLLIVLSALTMNAQTYEWQKPVQKGEKELELVLDTVYAGGAIVMDRPNSYCKNVDVRRYYSVEALYKSMYDTIKQKIGDSYPNFGLRHFKWRMDEIRVKGTCADAPPDEYWNWTDFTSIERFYCLSAIIVIPDAPKSVENPLSKALGKPWWKSGMARGLPLTR